jgi:hypothetical protein
MEEEANYGSRNFPMLFVQTIRKGKRGSRKEWLEWKPRLISKTILHFGGSDPSIVGNKIKVMQVAEGNAVKQTGVAVVESLQGQWTNAVQAEPSISCGGCPSSFADALVALNEDLYCCWECALFCSLCSWS